VFWGKDYKNKADMKNWYSDRYMSILIQRNFLILFTTIISFGILLCLIIIKNLQETKSIEPYIIEYDKNTGITSVVDTASKKEYTAQEAIKESLLYQYIISREGIKLSTIEETMNYVRVSSAAKVYEDYVKNIAQDLNLLRTSGKVTKFKIDINSITYLSTNKVEIKFTKTLIADDNPINTRKLSTIIVFDFKELDATLDDLRINPLGFQISYYKMSEEKIFQSSQSDSND
jgi:type IV secretion system protein VirB8